ncbi:glycosyltransferase family 2 protein [Microbacterium telephonicum]|uniref:glycosyltransferase family 2 protein n=1 Tax=Microbacterium telephonicum TaxID=1714841 RepID=UPI001F5442AF|nr:glycosyltransferase family 2 protein [Microbacterium telephonicum]
MTLSFERPVVSVVIPVRDDAELLERCLAALRAQTLLPDEIVVVDNASRDDSAAVAARMGARVAPCTRVGIPAAAARGYDCAEGDLILRLDADCVPTPGWIAAVVQAFADEPDAAALTGTATFHDGPRPLRRAVAAVYLGAYRVVGFVTLGHAPLFGSNMAMRRAAWEQVAGEVHREDARMHDDLDLSIHLGARHRIGTIPARMMRISMRPFADRGAFGRRISRGVHTVVAHWPREFPPFRWRRLAVRRLRSSSVASPTGVRR